MLQLVLFVCECVGGCGWGEAGGWMPLPTRLQRYCDPASLVLTVLKFHYAYWDHEYDQIGLLDSLSRFSEACSSI